MQAKKGQDAPAAGAPRTGRRGRPKVRSDEEQRADILQRATILFGRNGYSQTTTSDLAAFCGVSKQTLYRLCGDKLTLFTAVVEAHRLEMLALPGDYDALPLEEALEKIFRLDISSEADQARRAFLQGLLAEAVHSPQLSSVLEEHGGRKVDTSLRNWLDHQCALGRMRISDTRTATFMLLNMILGGPTPRTLGNFKWPEGEDYKAYARLCIRIFLNGVRPR